jgi:acyl-CoA synthetase (AMP-forming)/AMP-acid ligase II
MRRMAKLTGRSDDMLIIRGVNVFPSQIEELILRQAQLTPHYVLEISRTSRLDHPMRRLVSALLGVPLIPVLPPSLFRREPRQHDEHPHKPEQREERDASRTPIDSAKYVQTQPDQTGGAEDTVDTSINSHATRTDKERSPRRSAFVVGGEARNGQHGQTT